MSFFLSPDSKFMQVLSRLSDLVILNILFLLTSIPLFTLGASAAALYTAAFRMLRNKEEPLVKGYFRAFRENFRQGTALWLLFLFVALPAVFYFHRFFTSEGFALYLFVPFLTVLLAAVFTVGYAIPWISQFRNTSGEVLRNALILGFANLPRTVAVSAINLFPVALPLLQYELFLRISFLWFALYFAAAAYMNSAILWKVFKPFYPDENA